MDSNISELVKLGHERADELKASCGAVDVRSVAQLISDLASQLEVQYVRAEESQREFRSADITMQNLEAKCAALAAENAAMTANLIYWDAEDSEPVRSPLDYAHGAGLEDGEEFEMNVAARMPNRTYRVVSTSRFRTEIELVNGSFPQTPATDAFLAEVRASSIPEGYVLAPQQIFLDSSDIESICSQCGDGHESGYGDFTDGLLWVGNIQRDDGSIVHGLHISSADYSEEGGVTVCEFADQIRKGVQS